MREGQRTVRANDHDVAAAIAPPATGLLHTVGYQGFRDVDAFAAHLRDADVSFVLDVREIPWSRRRGFAKTALSAALAAAGIDYVHDRRLGNPRPIRERFWAGDVAAGRKLYREHLLAEQTSAVIDLVELLDQRPICLLCLEHDRCDCHRDVIANVAAERLPGLQVAHL